MNIEITQKSDGTYLADCTDFSGSVPIGAGSSKDEAIGNLIRKASKEIIGRTGVTWMQKFFNFDIKLNEVEEPSPAELWEPTTNVEGWECDI
jgi:hypothetical protein